jgi:hypothetical protein
MLELGKKILSVVSFDKALFQKELKKAIRSLKSAEDLNILKEWCIKEFGKKHRSIIREAFTTLR